MKTKYMWFVLIICLVPINVFGKRNEVSVIEPGKYFWMESERKTDFYFKRYIYSGYLTVVTLKHKKGVADFDVSIFSDPNYKNKISSSTAIGPKSELLVLPFQENSKYLYIDVNNCTDTYGKYEIYIHQIDLAKLAGEAFATSGMEYLAEAFIRDLFGVNEESSSSNQNEANRAAVALVSHLQGKSLSDTSESLLINEVRRAFTGENGFMSSFIVNFGTSLIKSIYLKY